MIPELLGDQWISQVIIVAPPVVPSKDMADEELKKTYGMHPSSRLQSEDSGKETKWADEDDDEDWVPETIEWNDGTKVALQVEPSTSVATSNAPTNAVVTGKATEKEKPDRDPDRRNESRIFHSLKDMGKGTEKSEKGVVQDAPLPRSPWATLQPPNTAPAPALRTEPQASDYGPPQRTLASREVHTDDFNRSWRDRPNRELFNSETGQLEPVQDRRNWGFRNTRADLQPGKTQVLQRPSSQLPGPAEPSPAFQQSRTASYRQEEYRRRRTSSNVSGGSASTGRRQSFNKGAHGMPVEHPLAPEEGSYSSYHIPQPLPTESQTSQASNGPLNAQTVTTPLINEAAMTPSEDFEDPISKQNRIMKEAREQARKRRLEEEAREEAAKKERLRVKLEQLAQQEAAKAAEAAAADAERLAEEARKAETARPMATTTVTAAVTLLVPDAALHPLDSEQAKLDEHNSLNDDAGFSQDEVSVASIKTSLPPQTHTFSSPHCENTYNPLAPPQPHQPQSLASAPYKPGSFGARSPTKNFSPIHPPNPHCPSSPSKTYNLAYRDPRYDPLDPPGSRYANIGRHQYNAYEKWRDSNPITQTPHNRATPNPWGSVGDKSRFRGSDSCRSGFNPPIASEQLREAQVIPNPNLDLGRPQVEIDTATNEPKVNHLISAKASKQEPVNMPAMHPDKPKVNPWASYPEQLQREEEEDRRRNRQQYLQNNEPGFKVAQDVYEVWTPIPRDTSSIHRGFLGDKSHTTIDHLNTQHDLGQNSKFLDGPPSHLVSRFFQPTSPPVIGCSSQSTVTDERITLSREPSSPPPPDCHVKDVHGENAIPAVRLPPPRASRGPTIEELSEVQKKIQMKIQASKMHQLSPPSSAAVPEKFLDTKSVYPEERDVSRGHLIVSPSLSNAESSLGGLAETEQEETLTKPNEEELFAELYVQDFGSQPTVKIPSIPHNGSFTAAQPPSVPKSKKTSLPKDFAVSVHFYEIVSTDDLVNDQGYSFIPVRLSPDGETKQVIRHQWSKPPRREPKKYPNSNNSSNSNSSQKPRVANYSNYKKDSKAFVGSRSSMHNSSAPKQMSIHAWERQSHPVA